jgi:hypothetical protein
LFLVLALAGCGDSTPKTSINAPSAQPAYIQCDYPMVTCAVAVFTGFPEFPGYMVMPIAADTSTYCEDPYTDPNISTPDGIVRISRGITCLSAYTYQYPMELFPVGHKWHKVGFKSDLLCADIFGCQNGEAGFPNLGPRSYIWHGDSLNVQQEDRNVVFKHQGWTLIANEWINTPTYQEANAVHLIGPGGREVKISHVAYRCGGTSAP